MALSDLKNKFTPNSPNTDSDKKDLEVKKKEETAAPEKIYQTYSSGLENQKLITESGRVIRIRQHKYVTDNKEEIAYLDKEIDKGLPGIKKGEPMTTSDLDPMSALRKKFFAEFQKEIEAGNSEIQKLVPASTKDLANLSEGSNSLAGE